MRMSATVLIGLLMLPAGAAAQDETTTERGASAEEQGTSAEEQAASPEGKPESMEERTSYGLGFSVGRQWRDQQLPIDLELVVSGLRDGFGGAEGRLSDEEVGKAMEDLQRRILVEADQRNRRQGAEFLRTNSEREGVTTLASGLQYEILQAGTGTSPGAGDTVTVHYRGTLIDGTVFDSSYERGQPVTIGLENVISGWQQALPLMKTGGKWKLFVPADLAYGSGAAGPMVGPGSTLIFEVELLSVKAPEEE